MTPKQQRFVDEYLIDLNAAAAYRRAGYQAANDQTAAASAHKLLRNADVKQAIDAARLARSARAGIDADAVLRELHLVGMSDLGDILDFTGTDPRLRPAKEIPERARRAISTVKVKRYFEGPGEDAREVEVVEFKLWDKLSALEKLGKHLGLFVDRSEVNVKVEKVEEMSDGDLQRIARSGGDRTSSTTSGPVQSP